MGARRATFWLGVAGVSILAQFGLALAAAKVPSTGLAKFASFTQGGTGN